MKTSAFNGPSSAWYQVDSQFVTTLSDDSIAKMGKEAVLDI